MNLVMVPILFIAAIIPVILLGLFIYFMDTNHEPIGLLAKVFGFGFLSAIPVIFIESGLGIFFPTDGVTNLIVMFINIFFSVALVEEGFKWLVTRFFGYNSKEFDEVFDIIVYAVFASLGFACIENILYVMSNGLLNALLRAIMSVPGHACDGVIMGFFLVQAKIGSIENNKSKNVINIILSILVPTITHTIYDSVLFTAVNNESLFYLLVLFAFYICQVIVCIIIVIIISRAQKRLYNNINVVNNNQMQNDNNFNSISTYNNLNNNTNYTNSSTINNNSNTSGKYNFCPECGNNVSGSRFCGSCGHKLF